MSKADFGARFCRFYGGHPYIDLSVPGASSAISIEEARHLLKLLTKALAQADRAEERRQRKIEGGGNV